MLKTCLAWGNNGKRGEETIKRGTLTIMGDPELSHGLDAKVKDEYFDRTVESSPSGEEELRFIRNFHDVFLSIGIGIFGVGIIFVTSQLVVSMAGKAL